MRRKPLVAQFSHRKFNSKRLNKKRKETQSPQSDHPLDRWPNIEKIMAPKGRMDWQSKFSLRDDEAFLASILREQGFIPDEYRNAHAQGFVPNHGNTSFTARTQVGRRIYNGNIDKEHQGLVTRSRARHEDMPLEENVFMGDGFEEEDVEDSATRREIVGNETGGPSATEGEIVEKETGGPSATEGEIVEKQKRGPTYMKSIWGHPPNLPLIPVEYNALGQPTGGEHSQLAHFLGTVARNGKFCPIDVTDWHAMLPEKKREMLEFVKMRFYVPTIAEKFILSSLGHKWRNWKHSLKNKYWSDDDPIEKLIHKRDPRVAEDQWIKLLYYWRTEDAKKTSQRNQSAREKKIMDQRTGKTSFAQVIARLTKEKGRPPTRVEILKSCYRPSNESSSDVSRKYSAMQERSSELLDVSEDAIGPNDIFAQIMGKDKPGHVRMMGQGICPSDLWSETPRSSSNRREMEYRAKIAELQAKLSSQQRSNDSQVCSTQNTSTFESMSSHAAENLHHQVGAYVSLRSLFTKKIVAKGFINSMDPNTKVGGQMLGLNWCEVNVKVIVQPKEQLVRPYGNFQELSQTLGAMIAWPCSLVSPI